MAEPTAQWRRRIDRQSQQMAVQQSLHQGCTDKRKKQIEEWQNFCVPGCTREHHKCEFGRFHQVHYEPSFSCLAELRMGNAGEGGKWVCDPFRLTQKIQSGGSCLVYVIGSRSLYKFE